VLLVAFGMVWAVGQRGGWVVGGVMIGPRRDAALAARADQQYRWAIAGDDRGVYGNYPAAATGYR
jgi:hypothetical protein